MTETSEPARQHHRNEEQDVKRNNEELSRQPRSFSRRKSHIRSVSFCESKTVNTTIQGPAVSRKSDMIRGFICTSFLICIAALYLSPEQEDVLKCLFDLGLSDTQALNYLGCTMGGNCTGCAEKLKNAGVKPKTVVKATNCTQPFCCHQ
ncbi:hypothetical protein RB195_005335 [Necator americanus]|uniref:Uncharacterized protein n=1 Tax=Necator americanus TaxID=51031 RepID=A0ABR1BMB4_NECAM